MLFRSKHPKDNKVSGYKSNTTLGGEGFNEWRFDDTKGKEQIFLHAERNMDTRVKNDSMELVLHDRNLIVGGQDKNGNKVGDQKEKVFKDKHLHILGNQDEQIEGNLKLTIGFGDADGGLVDICIEKDKHETIEIQNILHVKDSQFIQVDKDNHLKAKGFQAESIDGNKHLTVGKGHFEKIGDDHMLNIGKSMQCKVGTKCAVDAGQEIHLKGGQKIIIEAGTQISLVVGGNFIDISASGVTIVGSKVMINSGGAAGSGSGCSTQDPTAFGSLKDAKKAAPADPVVADDSKSGVKSAPK